MRWWAAILLVACTTKPGAKDANDASGEESSNDQPRSNGQAGPQIESEIGALDEDAVKSAFAAARPAIFKCFKRANDGLEFEVVGGDVEVSLRVKEDGTLRWAYAKKSTLGHAGAEQCILDALREQTWPKAEGGDEGIAGTMFGRDAPATRPAVRLSSSDLGGKGGELRAKLTQCMDDAGTSSLSVTLYIDPDGEVLSAGGACGDEQGIDAVECGVKAAKSMRYPSPGSYPAKVTVTVD